jgi:hypothetical protein
MRAAGRRLAAAASQVLLIPQVLVRASESAWAGLQLPSMSQAGPVGRVRRVKMRKAKPITAIAAAAFSEYIARPAMLAEPIAIPSEGTAQQATQAMPVIQAILLPAEIPGGLSFFTLKSLLVGEARNVKPGVRSRVKP